ncbi:MAG: TetR/AcrR family transcriptional regulator [Deltaproteobacteria bacterium]|nr:TetR/AcrR family transcriptional regulator [Deltaproteobacteria bacterium]
MKKNIKGRSLISERNVRERILKAAREVFTEYSFKQASTRMIAKQAGVEHPMIHYYFGSKENLFYAMAEALYNETLPVQESWYDNLENMSLQDSFSLFIDRMLDYTMAKPDALRIAALNAVHIGNIEEIPGYRFILMSMAAMRRIMEEKLALKGSNREIEMFIYCFYSLMISLVGARSCQAQILNMNPLEEKYRVWVKDASMTLFYPWFKKILTGQ